MEMRRPVFNMSREESIALLKRSKAVHLASTREDGMPMLKTLHGVIHEGYLAFHSGPAGEKTHSIGREAVIGAEEMVADIPSTFSHPEKACPATTYYKSVQVHGKIEEITDLDAKASILQALMERYQPSGGYVPITADHPHYKAAVKNIIVAGVSLERVQGKHKLGQHRPEKINDVLEKLWARGDKGDPEAIDIIRKANPKVPPPDFLQGPNGVQILCSVTAEEDLATATQMLDGTYWNQGFTKEQIRKSLLYSGICVGARDIKTGTLIGFMRATSDWSKHAWMYDVVIAPSWQRKGIGTKLVELLLDHPSIRNTYKIHLRTRDADRFYERFGFRKILDIPTSSSPSIYMVLEK